MEDSATTVARVGPEMGDERGLVGAREDAGHARDHPFQAREHLAVVKPPVAPARGDAIVHDVGCGTALAR